MPTRPTPITLTNSSVDVINAIRNTASVNYRNYVPVATPDADSIREIGKIIMDYPALQNEFINTLINRIGRVVITSKTYENPWSMFKKGFLEFGETVEEIFVELAKPFQYDPAVAENELFKRVIPDVRSAFHPINYKKFYKVTIQNNDLKQAFLSWDGVTDLISKIVETLYTAHNYDEFQVMKYLLAKHITQGNIHMLGVADYSVAANAKSVVSTIKGASNDFEFMSTDYNLAGVHTHSAKEDQYVIINSKFDAIMDVEVLASAFNMNRAEFMGNRVLVDGFGKLDIARLKELLGDQIEEEFDDDTLASLNNIPVVLVDRDFFQIFDNEQMFAEDYNGQGLYWQYFYHVWKTFAVSPFANAVAFSTVTPVVTAIEVSADRTTARAGSTVYLTADVTTAGYASEAVVWSVDEEYGSIDGAGNFRIASGVSPATQIVVTATTVGLDANGATMSDTVTISVGN